MSPPREIDPPRSPESDSSGSNHATGRPEPEARRDDSRASPHSGRYHCRYHAHKETEVAERILGSDLIPLPARRAAISALEAANADGRTPTMQDAVAAACAHRADIEPVAAILGFGRCVDCLSFIHAGEFRSHGDSCYHKLDFTGEHELAGLRLWQFTGGTIRQLVITKPIHLGRASRHRGRWK